MYRGMFCTIIFVCIVTLTHVTSTSILLRASLVTVSSNDIQPTIPLIGSSTETLSFSTIDISKTIFHLSNQTAAPYVFMNQTMMNVSESSLMKNNLTQMLFLNKTKVILSTLTKNSSDLTIRQYVHTQNSLMKSLNDNLATSSIRLTVSSHRLKATRTLPATVASSISSSQKCVQGCVSFSSNGVRYSSSLSRMMTSSIVVISKSQDEREITGAIVLVVTFICQIIFFVAVIIITTLAKKYKSIRQQLHWSEKGFGENSTTV